MQSDRTRDLLLQALRQRPASSAELAISLGLTPAGVRYHLSALLAQGLVEPCPPVESSPTRRGRPTQTYRVRAGDHANNYRHLAEALLTITADEDWGNRVSAALLRGYSPHRFMRQRLPQAIRWLNERGYQASWEARPAGPLVIFHNCPYAAIWPSCPRLCAMDARLVSRLLGAKVEMVSAIQPESDGYTQCRFQINT